MPSATADRRLVVPYVTTWTGEQEPSVTVVERRTGGIGYARENLLDRDEHGVLWSQLPSCPGRGRPEFGKVHPLRQRRAMRRLLCQVCGGPADRDETGDVLWLWKDHREDWPGWPEGMWVTEPPVCVPCVGLAVRLCPALRGNAVTVRVRRCPVVGVYGTRYRRGLRSPVAVELVNLGYDNPAVRWVQADHLIRELRDATIVPVEGLIN